jgi:hypothetical protein
LLMLAFLSAFFEPQGHKGTKEHGGFSLCNSVSLCLGGFYLLNSDKNVQECDTTKV